MRHPAFDQHERDEQCDPGHQQRDRQRRPPALGLGLGQPVDDADQPGHDQHRAWWVETNSGITGLVAQQPHRGRDRDQREDDVDVQTPAPGQVLGQDAAQQQPDRTASSGDGAVDAEGLAALGRVGERHGERGQRSGREHRAERTLDRAARQQHAEADGRASQRRRGGEAHHADDQHPLAPKHVREPAAEQQQPAEGQRIGGHHPLPVRIGERQVMLGGRQRDVHHGGVQHHHQLGQADNAQDQPATVRLLVGVGRSRWPRHPRCGSTAVSDPRNRGTVRVLGHRVPPGQRVPSRPSANSPAARHPAARHPAPVTPLPSPRSRRPGAGLAPRRRRPGAAPPANLAPRPCRPGTGRTA